MRFVFAVLLIGVLNLALRADDEEARRKADDGAARFRDGDFHGAVKAYDQAHFLADDPILRCNALQQKRESCRRAELLSMEFDTIEELLTRYSAQCDFAALTAREYAIADAYRNGHRDPEFWSLRWIPWLTGPDRSIEMYRKALERAPFAKEAAPARLRLAYLLDDDGKTDEAINQLRILLNDYPSTPQYKFALLGLGEMLYKRSQAGDGDGSIAGEAATLLARFKQEFPNAPETAMAERIRLQAMDARAKQLLGTARFYAREDRSAAAAKYLSIILRDYPDSESAPEAERMLVELDETYTPDAFLPEAAPRNAVLTVRRMPEQPMPLLIAPDNSNGKYLLPVYDLRAGRVETEEEKEK